jgi:dehydrogenase/reductase SDR family protein 7B
MVLQDKVVWIAGASSGIGKAVAYAFNHQGARLVLSARREKELYEVKSDCARNEGDILVLPLDLQRLDELDEKARKAIGHFGKIDILINCVGVSQRSLAKDTDIKVDKTIMDINYFGAVGLTKAILPYMLKRKAGHIVVISSLTGYVGAPMRSAYAASKHALHGFFDSLRGEVWRDNIYVTIVCPGFVRSGSIHKALTGDGSEYGKKEVEKRGAISPEVCAKHILKAVLKKKEELYVGGKETALIYVKRYFPRIFSWGLRTFKERFDEARDS